VEIFFYTVQRPGNEMFLVIIF